MSGSHEQFKYSGTDNLEVMLEAVKYNRFLTDEVLKHLVGNAPVLDFGAGVGTFSLMVRESGVGVDCFEVDKAHCDVLLENGFQFFSSAEEVADESYDYIFSLNVFEHIEDDLGAAKAAFRMLRPGGRIYIYVPAFQILFGDMDRKVEHFRRYRRSSLQRLVEGAGFETQQTGYVDFIGYFATLAYNAISNGKGDVNTKSIRIYDRLVFPVSRLIDKLSGPFLGKNAFVVANKPQ